MDLETVCQNIEADVAELKELISKCLRPSNQERLNALVSQLEAELNTKRSDLQTKTSQANGEQSEQESSAVSQSDAATPPAPPAAASQNRITYTPIESFAWDQGEYNSEWVTIYVMLDGVGSVKDNIICDFTQASFDLKITDFNGKNFRLVKDNLDKDIIPDESKFIVKKNKVLVKLKKVKGEYSYEHWSNLTAKKRKDPAKSTDKDPMGGLMDMMKDMYEDGDDNMKKVIGEAMEKAQRGEKSSPSDFAP
mmetsp:Transcript_33601/g.42308  ORF Transcript_33601/g.42308 Transcript_33601/m.42308 type:complete len:251 (+) Transcript_33601:97-849(+)